MAMRDFCPMQQVATNAPAGSRARGTSMGGLYVTATLQAPLHNSQGAPSPAAAGSGCQLVAHVLSHSFRMQKAQVSVPSVGAGQLKPARRQGRPSVLSCPNLESPCPDALQRGVWSYKTDGSIERLHPGGLERSEWPPPQWRRADCRPDSLHD